ncbi:MAG: DNA primase [Omnitrophica WOR_2 bacterium RIFCSPHIGHO2_01_FULL_52_10]|nr:MAG: DNA primase [Omnitrophica WOR_2 bacterium RIFCSPHIGHO2_01_FULL_52_10]
MGLIPEEIIAQIIDRCDIVETISSYIPLKRMGRSFKAACPFHHEKTPSFIVNPDKQIFHCFGCGVGGNVVNFVMKQERMEFPEAVRFLAQKVNVSIPGDETPQAHHANNIRQAILRVNALAAGFFHKILLADKSAAAKNAREYLKSRAIDLDAVRVFQLGFAPNQWDALLTHLKQEGISLRLMEKAGLIIPRESGQGYYDRFRNRIVFPIFDTRAHCRAFGARALESAEGAKYLNSPETIIYTKGHHLYGFHLAKQAIAAEDCVVIVEGYVDCLIPYQAGVRNIVASLGTALTVDQIRLLRRYTPHVVMLFDMDPAGEAAMMRSLDTLIEEGMEVRVAALEDGEDPDSFVRRRGVDDFRGRIAGARALFDYKLDVLTRRHGMQTADGKAQIAAGMLPTIYRFTNELIKAEYLKRLARALEVPEDALAREYQKVGQALSAAILSRIHEPAAVNEARVRAVERGLLKLMIEQEKWIPKIRQELTLEDFQDTKIRMAITRIFDFFEHGKKIDTVNLINSFEDAAVSQMLSSIVTEEEVAGDREKMYQDYINRIKHDQMKTRKQKILQQIQEAESAGNFARVSELSQQFNQFIKHEGF